MNGRKFVLGLSLLCALVCSGIAASSASAIGTTVVECVSGTGTAGFEDEHCVTETKEKAKIKFVHKEVGVVSKTKVTGTNEKTTTDTSASESAILEFTFKGILVQITCTGVSAVGTVSNVAGPPMSISGSGTITYKGCTVTKPAGQGCEIVSGEIVAEVTAVTKENTMEVELKPNGAAPFASFETKGCTKDMILNGIDQVTGTLNAIPEGVTLDTTNASTEKTLKVSGAAAKLRSKTTMRMEGGNPLTLTTL